MKYKVKMRQIIFREYEVEVSDDMVDNVVDAMDIAEGVMEGPLAPSDRWITETVKPWAPVSVTTEE